jgi:transposase-like protein
MASRNYSDETKAAVLAALLAGQSISEVSGRYNIPEGTVKAWKSRTVNNGGGVATVATPKKERIGELLVELVETEIETLIHMSKAQRDEKWFNKQSAADIAVLKGVTKDKLMRILEAFESDGNSDL